jgi:hypothetical protein
MEKELIVELNFLKEGVAGNYYICALPLGSISMAMHSKAMAARSHAALHRSRPLTAIGTIITIGCVGVKRAAFLG